MGLMDAQEGSNKKQRSRKGGDALKKPLRSKKVVSDFLGENDDDSDVAFGAQQAEDEDEDEDEEDEEEEDEEEDRLSSLISDESDISETLMNRNRRKVPLKRKRSQVDDEEETDERSLSIAKPAQKRARKLSTPAAVVAPSVAPLEKKPPPSRQRRAPSIKSEPLTSLAREDSTAPTSLYVSFPFALSGRSRRILCNHRCLLELQRSSS